MGSSLQQTELRSGPVATGWGGVGGERSKGDGLCMHTAGSLRGAAENNTTRESDDTSIKKEKKATWTKV